jgi:hypothetical protein
MVFYISKPQTGLPAHWLCGYFHKKFSQSEARECGLEISQSFSNTNAPLYTTLSSPIKSFAVTFSGTRKVRNSRIGMAYIYRNAYLIIARK